jgi:hypothetical protein
MLTGKEYIQSWRKQGMAVYKTKYFGDFEAADNEETVEIETFIQEDGEDKEVVIVISHFKDYKGRMHEFIELLDNYFNLHETIKAYIGEKYEENEDFIDFLFKYAGQLAKQKYLKNGSKTITFDLDTMIKHFDLPSVSLQEYSNGKITARLSYYGPDNTDISLLFDIDRDHKIYGIQYHGQY